MAAFGKAEALDPNVESWSRYAERLAFYFEANDIETLENRLRDQLVWGIGSEQIQKKLLAVTYLTWKKAVELTLAQEAADQGAQALQPPKDVHKVIASPQAEREGRASQLLTRPQRSCYRCGESHSSDVCRFKDVDCRFCRKRGHISRVCRQKEREGNKGPQSGKRRGNWAHRVAELSPTPPEEYEDEEEEIAVVLVVHDEPPSPMVVEVDLNGCKVSFEVDTGASRSVIGEAT
ncbi:hypothetical protein SKAU_G00275780 [Synaphobranchus kaupii]|uniref:CCHC-type domain-containing protein n=1 Tax=Synaphobranchus kaupii TaxID=118154 RepID=A0A9Q1IR17_SYNKA|nr:hypothetical protein SKAU_G00275780 [Synaphobranchus kaupii]